MSQSASNNPENAENGKYRDNDAGESSRQNPIIEEEFIDFKEFENIEVTSMKGILFSKEG